MTYFLKLKQSWNVVTLPPDSTDKLALSKFLEVSIRSYYFWKRAAGGIKVHSKVSHVHFNW